MKKKSHKSEHVHRRVLVLIAITLVGTITLSTFAYNRLNDQSDRRFVTDTLTASNFIINDIKGYSSVLYSARSFAMNTNHLNQEGWDGFIKDQQTFANNPGISAVFLVTAVPKSELSTYAKFLQDNSLINNKFTVNPEGDRAVYGFSTYVSSLDDLSQYRNFDLFSTTERRLAYESAAKQNKPIASKPINLATGVNGFFIALPIVSLDHSVKQYVAASFHTDSFISSVYKDSKVDVATHITDITDSNMPISLFSTNNWRATNDSLTRNDTIKFGDRTWRVEYKSARSYDTIILARRLSILIMLLGSIIIALLLVSHVRALKLIN